MSKKAETKQAQQSKQQEQKPKNELLERVKSFFEKSGDWERQKIKSDYGIIVNIIKLPQRSTKTKTTPARVGIEVRLEQSAPTNRLLLMDGQEMRSLIKFITTHAEHLQKLGDAVSSVNGVIDFEKYEEKEEEWW